MALGSGSVSFLSVIISWTTIAINIPMMISYFKVSTGFIFIAGIVASVICVIPIIFYDLSEKKHADYIRTLKIRAVVQNYKNNEISDEDILTLREIADYAEENKNKFLFDELNSFEETELIPSVNTQPADNLC